MIENELPGALRALAGHPEPSGDLAKAALATVKRQNRIRAVAGTLAAVVVLAGGVTGGVLATRSSAGGTDRIEPGQQTAAPAPTAAATTPAYATGTPAPTSVPATTPPALPTVDTNLVATPDVKAQLLQAFTAEKSGEGLAAGYTGPVAGTTYYGYLAGTQTYWAIAQFSLPNDAPMNTLVGMQDGGAGGVFKRAIGGSWQWAGMQGLPFPCPDGELPDAMVQLWHLTYSPGCEVSSTAVPFDPTKYQVVDDAATGSFAGRVLQEDLMLSGQGNLTLDPETEVAGGRLVNEKPLQALDLSVDTKTRAGTGSFDKAFADALETSMGQTGSYVVVTAKHGVVTSIELHAAGDRLSASDGYTEP